MAETLTLQHFSPHLGAGFQVAGFEGLTLTLAQANALIASKRAGQMETTRSEGRAPFDLIFVGPASPILPQRIYQLERVGQDPLEIFIVPIGPQGDGMGYQAIFT